MKKLSPLESIITPAVSALGFEMISCSVSSVGRNTTLRILVDNPGGSVTVDDCMRVSQQISAILDIEAPFAGQYYLEVSSPGLDRPLVKPEHFQRFLGRQVKIKLNIGLAGRRNFCGELLSATEDEVRVKVDNEIFSLPMADIDKANLVPELRF